MTEQEKAMMTMDFDFIPDYLCNTNPSFENKIKCILPSTIKLEELRDIAILMHKIMSIGIVQSLWIVYRKSGLGNLPSALQINQLDRKVWPIKVQSLLQQSQMRYMDEDEACLIFVNHHLQQMNSQSDHYRHEFNVKTCNLRGGYSPSLEHILEKFIQQGLQYLRMDIEQQIAMVSFDYMDRILERAYSIEEPDHNQVSFFELF